LLKVALHIISQTLSFHFIIHVPMDIIFQCVIFPYPISHILSDSGNRSTRRKPPTCRKSLTSFIT
jgi:hypothetical protein